jgi:hypothetical protein
MDWALIESWKEMNIPLHVALRGIEKSFDSWESKPRKRTVKTLLYCQEEVQAQYAEWLETQTGATLESASTEEAADQPFAPASVLEHLARGRFQLITIAEGLKRAGLHNLSESLLRAADLVKVLENDFLAERNTQKLEVSLTGIERMLSDAIMAAIPAEQLTMVKREITTQLKPYRSDMGKDVYDQTFQNLLLKRLRDYFDVPRLSLFYL